MYEQLDCPDTASQGGESMASQKQMFERVLMFAFKPVKNNYKDATCQIIVYADWKHVVLIVPKCGWL